MSDWIVPAVMVFLALIAKLGIELRFGLRRRIMRVTYMRRWPEKRVWWPGAFLHVIGLIAAALALEAALAPFLPESEHFNAVRPGILLLLMTLLAPRKEDREGRDETGPGRNAA
jgi:hypothetical protein